jgi:hypothetical protein
MACALVVNVLNKRQQLTALSAIMHIKSKGETPPIAIKNTFLATAAVRQSVRLNLRKWRIWQ